MLGRAATGVQEFGKKFKEGMELQSIASLKYFLFLVICILMSTFNFYNEENDVEKT